MIPGVELKKDKRSSTYRVALHTPKGKQWITTGERTRRAAEAVCDAAMLEKLNLAARAGVLNADAISRLTTGRRFTCMDVLASWKSEAILDKSPATVANYEAAMIAFFADAEIENKPVALVTRTELDRYVNGPAITAGTRTTRRAAANSFFGFAMNAGYCAGNVAARVFVRIRDLTHDQIEPKIRGVITAEEYQALMNSPKCQGFWRVATALAYWLGLRLSDVACLEWAQLKGDRIIIWTKKRGARIELPLSDPLIGSGELQLVLMSLIEQPQLDPVYVFPVERVILLDEKKRAKLSVYYTRILIRHGIRGKSFHSLRHSAVTRWRNAGKTLEEIGRLIGHANEETTQGYVHA